MVGHKLLFAIATTVVVAMGYLVFELQSLHTKVDYLNERLAQSQEESIRAQANQQAQKIQSNQVPVTADQTSAITLSNADINSLAELISQRLAHSMPVKPDQNAAVVNSVVIDTPEVKAAAVETAGNIIAPFIGVATQSQDWDEMGKRVAEIQDPALKVQTIGAILGAINSGELHPPDSADPDYLYGLFNPQQQSH